MMEEHSDKQAAPHLCGDRWRAFKRAYYHANLLTHHVLGATLKLAVVLYFILCLVFLVLRYAVLPNIGLYKPQIEHVLSSSLGRPVSIAVIEASWQGLNPRLVLEQVELRDGQGQHALRLPRVSVTLSWWSVFIAGIRLDKLEIDQPELAVSRSRDGRISVAGWWLDPAKKSDTTGLDWLLAQREIVITNGIVRWDDQQRGAPVLALNGVRLTLQNRWRHHKFALYVTPPVALAGPFDIVADFVHPVFSRSGSDYKHWKGDLFADVSRADLAAWKQYLDYPFEVQQGVGAVRAWLRVDQARMVDFTADLRLSDVKARLRSDLQLLDLLTVSGRISAQEIISARLPFISSGFAANGHQISLTNFTFDTSGGLHLPQTNFTEKYLPATRSQPEQLSLTAKFLDLNVLANLLVHLPLPLEYRTMLQEFNLGGQLSNFSAQLQGKYPDLIHYKLNGDFVNLSMRPQAARQAQHGMVALPALPGFSNLTGRIDADEARGSIHLNSENVKLELPSYFSEAPMQFDQLGMLASWTFKQSNQLFLTLDHLDFSLQNMQAHFSGTHLIPINPDKKRPLGFLDLTGTVSHFDIQQLDHYLPAVTPADLRYWLSKGLESGSVNDVAIRIKGDLLDFPFVKKGVFDQNIFTVSGKIVDGRINYLPGVFAKDGVSTFWPVLDKIQGKITFDRESMDIEASSAETQGVVISKAHVRIPDLNSTDPWLNIDGVANAALQQMLHYVASSPVLDWIGNFTSDTQAAGNARLTLKLNLPLAHLDDSKVQGSVQFADNSVVLLRDLPLFSKVNGRLDFNERGLNLNTLKGEFLGGMINVTGGSQKDGAIRVKAEGILSADGLRNEYAQPQLRQLLSRINGATPYSALIQVKRKQTDIWVDSSLQGLESHFPAPLAKTAIAVLPLHFELSSASPQTAGGIAQDEIKLSLSSVVNAHYFRQKDTEAGDWRVLRGGIGINVAAPVPESGVALHMDVDDLNVDELNGLFCADTGVNAGTNTGAGRDIVSIVPDSSASLQATDITSGNSKIHIEPSALSLVQYVEPTIVAVRAADFTVFGKKLNQVVVGASRQKTTWQANVDAKQASGYVTWDDEGRSFGHIKARLSFLSIPQSAAGDVAELLQDKNIHAEIPGLDVIVDDLELFGKKLGKLELQAKNTGSKNIASKNEWQVDKLSLINPDAQLTAHGKWSSQHKENQTELVYDLELADAGKLLQRFGYEHVLAGGKGNLTGELNWAGLPYALDVPSLSGHIQLDLQSGQFLKVEPGAAKLFAVLNLQALPRRLALDFRDVFSEGFAFDGITALAQITNGVAVTDNFKMRSVSATVLLGGTADIAGETQNLRVVVVPEINAGAASVVYGLAVNPVIGLGTFLAQLFLRKPLMKAFTFEYLVTGSWKEPNVVKLDVKSDDKVKNKH